MFAHAAPINNDVLTVRWLVQDFPPFHIVSGAHKNKGLRDQYLASLWKTLPELHHVLELSNGDRQIALMKAGEPVCSVSILRTPDRERIIQFSKQPFQYQLPVRLIVETQLGKALNAAHMHRDAVSLSEILNSGSVRLGTNARRRYGEAIDTVLSDARKHAPQKVPEFRDDSELDSLLRPMGLGRIDAALGYSLEVEYLRKQRPDVTALSYLPLSETPTLVPLYVACSHSEAGDRVIAALDARNLDDAASQRLHDDYAAQLLPVERKRFNAAMLKFHPQSAASAHSHVRIRGGQTA